ncbi:unnamed protein product [Pylaiella littoralis]
MQDDDSWLDAFSANAGLFFDNNTSSVSDLYGPLLAGDISPGMTTGSSSDPGQVATMPMPLMPSPAPKTQNNVINTPAARLPIPAMDFAALVGHQQQQQQQQQQQPHVQVVQVAHRPTTLVAAAPAPVSEEIPRTFMQSQFNTLPRQQQHRQGMEITAGAVPAVSARGRGRAPVLRSKPAAAAIALPTTAAVASTPATSASEEPPPFTDDEQGVPNQRGGESFTRKRDRAKLLRQQMNDGLDNLHEALVEISTSGANPSASAATSLIPIRGPRRAAVVACSAELVRDLISTCVALRTENASISERLSVALAAKAGLQQQQQHSQQQRGTSATEGSPLVGRQLEGQEAPMSLCPRRFSASCCPCRSSASSGRGLSGKVGRCRVIGGTSARGIATGATCVCHAGGLDPSGVMRRSGASFPRRERATAIAWLGRSFPPRRPRRPGDRSTAAFTGTCGFRRGRCPPRTWSSARASNRESLSGSRSAGGATA